MKRMAKLVRDLVTDPILFAIFATIVVMLTVGCGAPHAGSAPGSQQNSPGNRKGELDETRVILTEPTNVRFSVNDVVEILGELPAGSEVALSTDPSVKNPNYRNSEGRVARSETGFFHPVTIISVPKEQRANYPDEVIAGWNSIAGGLYISAGISTTALPVEFDSAD